jgi:hypothetical protein
LLPGGLEALTLDEFFNPEALGTVGGCGLMVWLIVNATRAFFGFERRWLMLAVSAALNLVLFFGVTKTPLEIVSGLVLLANTIIVAFAALGFQETTVKGVSGRAGAVQTAGGKRSWLAIWRSSWL